jgi:hypothetical protein
MWFKRRKHGSGSNRPGDKSTRSSFPRQSACSPQPADHGRLGRGAQRGGKRGRPRRQRPQARRLAFQSLEVRAMFNMTPTANNDS